MSLSFLQRQRAPPLVHTLSFPLLLVVPVLLAVATVIGLFLASDVNAALLWSQCHARARIPVLSRIPGVGTVLCYLPSFFHEALASVRSAVVMAAVLAFVGALLTVCLVEAARVCNSQSKVIKSPTGVWLVFNLLGGAAIWQLVIVPAFMWRAKELFGGEKDTAIQGVDDSDSVAAKDDAQLRHIPREEVIAISVSVALGYYLPSILMVTLNTPAIICVWLFFPLLVALIRHATKWALLRFANSSSPRTTHLEASRPSLLIVYAIPVVLSVLAHFLFVWHITLKSDDRKEMTRSTVAFIEFDIQAIGWTVLYWLLVEVGWEAPLAMIPMALVVGPGAATCLTWTYVREPLFLNALSQTSEGSGEQEADEQSPLLR